MAAAEATLPVVKERATKHVKDWSSSPPLLVSLSAGALAGAVAKTVIAPLDRTKIHFQISQSRYSFAEAFKFMSASWAKGGISALWRGNSATLARVAPYAGVQFAAHERWKRLFGVNSVRDASEKPLLSLAAGSLAGVTSQTVTYPLDAARAKMAVARANVTLGKVLGDVYREGGGLGLYRGYLPTVLGVIPYAGVSFFTYDVLKHNYAEVYGSPPGGVWRVVLGGAAGALGQTASYPLDIVRRRMQTSQRRPDGTYPYATIAETLSLVYSTEGWRGFFKGLTMNWVKGPIAVGVSFATYDKIKITLLELNAIVEKS